MIKFQDFPKNGPYAAASVIIHPTGLVLTVSRKYDFNDLGLPGGKLDLGENFVDACIRETKEETGLVITKLIPVFGDYCGRSDKHVVHWNLTFLCVAQGQVTSNEKGRIVWVPNVRLICDKAGKLNSFGDYNMRLFSRLSTMTDLFSNPEWHSDIDLSLDKVER